MPRARTSPQHVLQRLEVRHVGRQVREHPLVEGTLAPVVMLHRLPDVHTEFGGQERAQAGGGAAQHSGGDRRVVHVLQRDVGLGQEARVEGDVVHDLGGPSGAEERPQAGERDAQPVDHGEALR